MSAFLIQSPADFHDVMTDANKGMNPLDSGSDPEDTGIRINPEIRIRFPGHSWLKQPKLEGPSALGVGESMRYQGICVII